MKIPESVLVVIHTSALEVLLIERADHPGFWQSVTGSLASTDETPVLACRREVLEETGIDSDRYRLTDWQLVNRYEIYPSWRHRYAQGVTHNTEHVFGLELPARAMVTLSAREHRDHCWLPWREAADRCFSWTNAGAIRELPGRVGSSERRP
ncbi:MAG: dihydroneopterin triphosphate diphosphatase [Burkholderiaceae bacterium]